MTVKIEGFRKSYVGLASDPKPMPSSTETVTVGSTFYEEDTGNTMIWDGYRWASPVIDTRVTDRLDTIICELKAMKELQAGVAMKLSGE